MNIPVITISSRSPDPVKEPYYHFREFKESCRRHSISPVFLSGQYNGLMSKPRLLLDYLLREHDSPHVIVTDAWDIVWLTDVDEILYNYGDESRIVFNAEANCFPRVDLAPQFPDTGTPYRFLNSGFFIGPTHAVIAMLSNMEEQWGFPDDKHNVDGTADCPNDQEFYMRWFLENQNKARLDCAGVLCQSLHGAKASEFAFLPDTGRVVSLLTGNQPCAVHGNGSGKEWLQRIIGWLNL